MLLVSTESSGSHRSLHSFPTRRSSDLAISVKKVLKLDKNSHFIYLIKYKNKKRYTHKMSIKCQNVAASSKPSIFVRSEEHTSELQSRENLVCRLLLEKKNWGHRRSRRQ